MGTTTDPLVRQFARWTPPEQVAGTASCAVAWSLRGREGLAAYQPDYLINDMRELLEVVRG